MMKRFALVMALSLASSAYAEDIADVWKAKCKSCHGEDGKAQTKMGQKESIDDFSSPAWQKHESDEELREVITEGSSRNKKMKAYKDKLTPEQIDGLVRYIRTLKAK
ncbi:cytochrome c [Pyxidicoccus parkwayensis]|uniref:Cytochrome c n=1 Tax=Pyxidicoccus parkwayensis TaxID=2813578 RepID=A0ABX7NMZ9_9BACT|nr:cytochrome c [Pyxidicoccus parkwaysis]QSQ20232.1 cytochrome c [Pyxidicoccus parkwaysis]